MFVFITELMRSAGTYLYGRRMYETLAVWETDATLAIQSDLMADYASAWQSADKVVYSSTLAAPRTANTRLERHFDPSTVRDLKAAASRDLLVGGPNLAAQALVAGLVDELALFVSPFRPRVRSPSLRIVRRILVTGMSGTGKSSALRELASRGFRTVDTDEGDWTEWRDDGSYWREDRIEELLAAGTGVPLFVAGTVTNQGRFYPRFDAVVLLSAPADVLLERIARRTTNPYGKSPEERELVLMHIAEVEPLLRATCTHELDATRPLADVVEQLARLAAPAG